MLVHRSEMSVKSGELAKSDKSKNERDSEYDYLRDEYIPYKKPDKKSNSKETSEEETSGEQVSKEVTFDITNYQLTNLTASWDQLGWKVLCDEDEWKGQFAKVRSPFTKCVELSKIVLPGERDTEGDKQRRTMGLIASDGVSNPMCRLSRNWLNCYHYLAQVPCLDPDPVTLEASKEASSVRATVDKYLPKYKNKDSWIAMHRAYKWHCLATKSLIAASAFASFLHF